MEDMKPSERAVLITYRLLQGGQVTTREAAQMFGVSLRTAQRDLVTIALLLPVDREGGVWRVLRDEKP